MLRAWLGPEPEPEPEARARLGVPRVETTQAFEQKQALWGVQSYLTERSRPPCPKLIELEPNEVMELRPQLNLRIERLFRMTGYGVALDDAFTQAQPGHKVQSDGGAQPQGRKRGAQPSLEGVHPSRTGSGPCPSADLGTGAVEMEDAQGQA
eukprot:1156767-Pelagomonas_calceolata.AAC.3